MASRPWHGACGDGIHRHRGDACERPYDPFLERHWRTCNHLSRVDLNRIEANKRISTRIRNTHTLVIDEISMLSAGTFALAEMACRMIRGKNEPFGGLQVVLVGDFFQLPPIVRREENDVQERIIFENGDNAESIFAFSSSAWDSLDPPSAIFPNSIDRKILRSLDCFRPFVPKMFRATIGHSLKAALPPRCR